MKINNKMIKTTPGRVIFNESINNVLRKMGLDDIEFVNHVIGKKDVSILIYNLYIKYGNKIISKILNSLKSIGFKYSTLSGLSISIEDLTIPEKPQLINNALKEVEKLADSQKKVLSLSKI